MFTNLVKFCNPEKMNMRISPLFLLVFVATFLTTTSEQIVIYGRIGAEVVLKPPTSPTSDISRVLWKHNGNLAVEWDGPTTEQFSHFKGRSSLNRTTGELTIENLTEEQSGNYEVLIDGIRLSGSITLKVISPAPTPRIYVSCDVEKMSCTLTCLGNVTAMDPKPTYIWKFNATELKTTDNTLEIKPETSAYDFICEIENPVSRESSQPVYDPFTRSPAGTEGDGDLKISTGLIVFGCLLAIVVGVALVHRVKSGMWFYQKDSMPWEADFWRKTESQTASEPQHENDNTEANAMMESNS